MRLLDASSIVYAWDNYPCAQLPPMWNWIALQVKHSHLAIMDVAMDEVEHVSPDCHSWLVENQIQILATTAAMLDQAVIIKDSLGITADKYHPNGVGENDVLIIAAAKVLGVELISNENRQTTEPVVMAKRKIPSVCKLPTVAVPCIDFLDYIKGCGQVFK